MLMAGWIVWLTCRCEKMTLMGNVMTFLTRFGGMMDIGGLFRGIQEG